jgi:hypothetical protein
MLTYRIDFYDYLKVPINFIKFRFLFPKDTLDESIKNETNTLGSTYSSNSSFDSSNSSSTKKSITSYFTKIQKSVYSESIVFFGLKNY